MPKPRRKKKPPKRVLALPDLEQTKSAVINSLTSKSGPRTYDHAITEFVDWYCSEPRLAFNRTVVLRYRIYLEQRLLAPTTINLRLAAVRRVAYEAADSGLLSPELAAGNPSRQRRTSDWRALGQLAHRRSRQELTFESSWRGPSKQTELCNVGFAGRLRTAARRITCVNDEIGSGSRATLGHR